MILYHWMNYFVTVGGDVFTYLRFLPPSFIFISGVVIANIYPKKYGFIGSRLYTRLITRGVKLLVLFTLLNVTANIFFTRSYSGPMPGIDGFILEAPIIYGSGNAKAAFGVLVPISYLLFLSAGIFFLGRANRYAIAVICASLFLLVMFLEVYGLSSSNLMLVGIGFLGILVGFFPGNKIDTWVDYFAAIVGLYLGYVLAISIFRVNYLLLAIGVCLSVMLIYLVGVKSVGWGGIRELMILLGKYSLFGYVVQIALLQLLHRGLVNLALDHWSLWVPSFVGAFAATIVAVKVAQEIRARSHAIDWLYKVTFS